MSERAETRTASFPALGRRRAALAGERYELAIFAVATVAAWAHTLDEVRIGELIAVPFGLANVAVVAGWPRLRAVWRGWASIGFGLLWGLAVIPYHIVPLLQGSVTGQHVSGVSRLVGGAAMVALGVAILLRSRRAGERA